MAGILEGKVAVVTGSTRGIGREIAVEFAAAGAMVVVHGTNAERATQVVSKIRAEGGTCEVCLGDVTDDDFASRLISFTVEKFGGVDILVANAGMSIREPFLTLSHQTWRRFLDVHVSGTFYCGQAAARRMVTQNRGGRIINMSSVAGLFGNPGFSAYATVKAAVIGLTRVQAVELAEYGITANALVPGPVWNEMMEELWGTERLRERCATIPLGRLSTEKEVARAALFLASDDARYVTGQVLVIDGGASAAGLYTHEIFSRRALASERQGTSTHNSTTHPG